MFLMVSYWHLGKSDELIGQSEQKHILLIKDFWIEIETCLKVHNLLYYLRALVRAGWVESEFKWPNVKLGFKLKL